MVPVPVAVAAVAGPRPKSAMLLRIPVAELVAAAAVPPAARLVLAEARVVSPSYSMWKAVLRL